ncbi:NADPH-quinone reductase [Herbaspirillum rubrisubalbicans]|uniref:NADPH-quinone reductase n=1 Tax=Herbaspirillum rubrisubalbicans TaxID=80842 RepID=A0ABX9C3V8_9BURK|nr:NADP-dependent oxidoreductase [Herbaspirillum rubrisubalbicans]MCP1576403.1 NADPH:quinone reductase-like Zn-dependent oxidoreductase [Herbaspirillum rubrisubalbicans]NQE50029.1 NADPH-quinone reductase [Herbaspirillum rubrisubalbicans]RAM65221.1 NADPH-quinone reductase [Herbaspirillum rubrisubalbicans]RAN48852.1 NADPH-quinone reductase [Herbaspirillum rubrisubalbicans]
MSPKTMKVVQQHTFGKPDVLHVEDAPVPALQPGEVLVRVHAVGLNPPDWYLREGYKMLPREWQPKVSFPLVLGTDISGVIEAVADDVKDFVVGDEVYSMVRFPSGIAGGSRAYAQYVNVSVTELAHKPKRVSHEMAAAAPMSLLTAWQFLIEQGHEIPNPLQPNQHEPVALEKKTVLLNGAAGGVGHFALQLAKWKGARVIAVGSGRHEAFLRDLGADEFIDYTRTAAEEVVRDVDLVVDAVGGPTTGRFLRTLKRGGALYPIFPLGFSGAEEAKRLGVVVSTTQVRSSGAQLQQLAELLDDGVVRVAIDSTFALQDADKAHERAAQGHIRGKIVLSVIGQG